MRLEQIGAYGYGAQLSRVQRKNSGESTDEKKGNSSKKGIVREDAYIPTGPTPRVKASSLDEVQERISSNFYNSDLVNEDLTEVFSKLLDRSG